jgi:formylglycine-generating enzyme required for sulfatase activity
MSNKFLMIGVLVTGLATSLARADVFNMPNGEASLQFVTVGDPNNPPDTTVMDDGTTGYGSVGYVYRIGEYDVTVGQYCEFLNAVATTDTYGLYNSYMALTPGSPLTTGKMPTVGIAQNGSPGGYTYSVSYNAGAWNSYATNFPSLYPSALAAAADCPIQFVSWGDAARFANWLQNGQPTNLGEAAGSTETGAYTLGGATTNSQLMAVNRNANATYFIPSENEWYKAAYYNPTGGTYWTYPTQSNSVPSNVLSATGTNNANFYNSGYTDPTNYLTPVGVFASSPGPFGTYDMGGDLWQWDEASIDNEYRGARGAPWGGVDYHYLASSARIVGDEPSNAPIDSGFRMAANVPEPSALGLLLACTATLLPFTRRKRTG